MAEKKKNETHNHMERNLWLAVMSFGVLVLMWFFLYYTMLPACGCKPIFPETHTAIVATNNAVSTWLQETSIAKTV